MEQELSMEQLKPAKHFPSYREFNKEEFDDTEVNQTPTQEFENEKRENKFNF